MAASTAIVRRALRLRLICLEPPLVEGADFGLQDRQRGIDQGRRQAEGPIVYEFAVTVSRQREGDALRFSGNHVHGSTAVPFVYLSLKRPGEHAEPWIRRIKVPLPSLTWAHVEDLPPDTLFVARVSGTRSGTVTLLDEGWVRQDAN